MKFEYLLFDAIIFLGSSLGVWLVKSSHWPKLGPAAWAIALVGIPYIVWDVLVTNKWWYFHPAYTLGIKIANLPIEEVLFFIVVPWSCLVIWENLKVLVLGNIDFEIDIWLLLGLAASAVLSFRLGWWYMFVVLLVAIGVVCLSWLTSHWFHKRAAVLMVFIVFGLILIFNGYLTSRPVVTYNLDVISGLKLFTIPLEDVIYGLALIAGVTTLYEHFLHRKS